MLLNLIERETQRGQVTCHMKMRYMPSNVHGSVWCGKY